jgi:transcriptional regulator with XRE-family HTH domain
MWVRPEDYKVFGSIMREARTEAGISQKDLAARLRKPQSFISIYENGQRRIDVLEFSLIVSAFGGDPTDLFRLVLKRSPIAKLRQHRR